ncbi:glycoside hydrolase N-terminal domain-containing protein [Paenibacillus allorhizosphaerae]|uniref:Glycoside hydrolase family 95 protein n=1 Tax=Paenibacillus allorhizosphaerae TaxID=2849866 RepID=A0ABM8VCV6_9BACL|nr:glycoside hydrolase family 95 protein [Paenibacillus allorhizosphaerae]CAG7625256.1 hypothetical protein PAECIP111802_01150 [Paenibacillus allorhizosphaerae]
MNLEQQVIAEKMSSSARSHRFAMAKPAVRWQDALPSGNGTMGALVYGNIEEDTIVINHEELWYGGITKPPPDLSVHLPELRALLDAGKYEEANRFFPDLMRAAGYQTHTSRFQPGFELKVTLDTDGAFRDYTRTLDMETGEITVAWTDNGVRKRKRLFVSRPDQVIVMSVRFDGAPVSQAAFGLQIHQPAEAEKHAFTHEASAEAAHLLASGKHSNAETGYCAAARVIARGGAASVQNGCLIASDADEITVLVKVAAKDGSPAQQEQLKRELNAFQDDYETLLQRHIAEHRPLFLSAGIDLEADGDRDTANERLLLDAYTGDVPTALMERMYDYGRYLLMSSSRPGGLPANLQGVWNGDYLPAWSGAFFNNENIQMNYWQALAGNMAEAAEPFYDFFDSLLPDMRRNAQSFYGSRGILSPLFASPESGLKKNLQPHVVYWSAGAGWLAQHYYDYWLFTGDSEFLKRRVIPFLKECAAFYEDFMVEGEDGKWISYPSNSPENWANGSFPGSGKVSVCINATMDFAVAKEVLTNLCEACEETGLHQEDLTRWRAMLGKIPGYQVNRDGALREWMHPDFEDNYHHRHQSHIYPLFPGFEITEETHPELFEACRIAVEKRLVIGLKQQTGWSLSHMAGIYARLGDGDRALECLEILSRSCLGDNLFTYHNDWRNQGISLKMGRAPFQIDANLGWTAAMQEMLLFSARGMIKLLPARPKRWVRGRFRHFRCRGGITVSLQWDMERRNSVVTLTADRSQSVELQFPAPVKSVAAEGTAVIAPSGRGPNYRHLTLTGGEPATLHITYTE